MINFRSHLKPAVIFFILTLISLAVFKVFMQIHVHHFKWLSKASYVVTIGKPHWLAYQNRILGPYMVSFISLSGLSYSESLKVFIFLGIFIQSAALLFVLTKMKENFFNAMNYIVLFSFLFIAVQHRWFYAWDSIDAIIFIFFVWGIFAKKPAVYFIFIFFISILNRETALFISLYIVIDSFQIKLINNNLFPRIKVSLVSGAKLAVGLILTVAGMVYTKFIRHQLFISKSSGADDAAHELIGNHIYLLQNVVDLFYLNAFSVNIVNSLFIFGAVGYLSLFVKHYEEHQLKAYLVFMIIIANIMAFGIINETRMYIILLPFLLFFHINIKRQDSLS